jgi:hypothetical protein
VLAAIQGVAICGHLSSSVQPPVGWGQLKFGYAWGQLLDVNARFRAGCSPQHVQRCRRIAIVAHPVKKLVAERYAVRSIGEIPLALRHSLVPPLLV